MSVHNTFMWGDMKGVYAVLKDPGMVNALMETVHEEMVWTPEMGMCSGPVSDYHTHILILVYNDTYCFSIRHVDAELQGEADIGSASGCQQRSHRLCGGAAVSWGGGER